MQDTTPRWQQNLTNKHTAQLAMHEAAFGKLGELQSEKQKRALRQANAKLTREGARA